MNAGRADHNAILKRVAGEHLAPLGLIQVGRTRTWLDDRGWFVTSVEFRPSPTSRGSSLVVAAAWLWWPGKDGLTYDYPDGTRVEAHAFESAESGDWDEACRVLAADAVKHVSAMRTVLPDISAASAVLNRHRFRRFDSW